VSRLRAVEHARPVLVAATSGISAIISQDGRVLSQSRQFSRAILVRRIRTSAAITLADRLGELPEWILAVAGTGAAAAGIWLLATRRYAAAAWSLVVAAAITLGTWAMLGFAGFQDYPRVARIFGRYYESSSYTPLSFLVHLGVRDPWARAGGLALGVAALVAVVVTARRNRSERTSFTIAVAAALLLTPIVWLHYFALMLVPLALLSPTFSVVWVLPVILWACPVGGHMSTWKYAFPLVVFAVVLLLAQRVRLRPRAIASSGRIVLVGSGEAQPFA